MNLSAMLVVGAMLTSLVPVTPPEERCTNRILFLVDVSGSMHGRPLQQSLASIAAICSQPIDDLQFGVLTFSNLNKQDRWPGIPEKNNGKPIPKGWAALPSAKAPGEAQRWLRGDGIPGCDTFLSPGLKLALREPMRNLTIVIVTDGVLGEDTKTLTTLIEKQQKVRENRCAEPGCKLKSHLPCRRLGKAVIICLGQGTIKKSLKAIAKIGKGGYFTEPEPVEETPKPTRGPAAPPTPDPDWDEWDDEPDLPDLPW